MKVEVPTGQRHQRFLLAATSLVQGPIIKHLWMSRLVYHMLNLSAIVCATLILDAVFNSSFSGLGVKMIRYFFGELETSPLQVSFPYITMCDLPEHDHFGSLQNIFGQCTLGTNKLLDKCVCLFWVLYIAGFPIALYSLLMFALQVLSVRFRARSLSKYCNQSCLHQLLHVCGSVGPSGWLVLLLIAPHVSPDCFSELITELATSSSSAAAPELGQTFTVGSQEEYSEALEMAGVEM